MATIIVDIPIAALFTFLFIHAHYQKYSPFSFVDNFLQFRVMLFNKKLGSQANKGTIISYVALCSFICSGFCRLLSTDASGYDLILFDWIALLVFLFILRLIYEFIVIPCTVNKSVLNKNTLNKRPTQMSYNTQQGYTVHYSSYQNQEAGNIQPQQQPQQQPSVPGSIDPAFKFCSQCGTKYNVTDDHCPNCGMQ